MLTRLTVRNFKRFEDVAIDLDSPVLFIGPNNSGKTTALQALALWDLGMRRWNEKRSGSETPAKRPGVTVNRRDLLAVPMLNARQIWRNLRVRNVHRVEGRQRTENICIEIVVEGTVGGRDWMAGLEFDYANEESFYCRPLRVAASSEERMLIPDEAGHVRVACLPPMSGLAANELRLEPGGIAVRIGEGRTAEVLRNLCFRVSTEMPDEWANLVERIESAFGGRLDPPRHIAERGEIAMSYTEAGVRLDVTATGRGMQQTILLLAHLALNARSVLILDEPDAHLEVIRQREIYELLRSAAVDAGSQIIAASHSEVLLQSAGGRDAIVAFVGQPHRIAERGGPVLKALRDIGYADCEQARAAGFVLYLEGATDLDVLKEFARRLGHADALEALDAAFVRPVGNQPSEVLRHFFGLREAWPQLRGCALFDRLERGLPDMAGIPAGVWRRREIENYLVSDETLLAWAGTPPPKASLFVWGNPERRRRAMAAAVEQVRAATETLRPGFNPAGPDAKVSDEYLNAVFHAFFRELGETDRMPKKRFHELVAQIPDEDIDPEIEEKLDLIAAAHAGATSPTAA